MGKRAFRFVIQKGILSLMLLMLLFGQVAPVFAQSFPNTPPPGGPSAPPGPGPSRDRDTTTGDSTLGPGPSRDRDAVADTVVDDGQTNAPDIDPFEDGIVMPDGTVVSTVTETKNIYVTEPQKVIDKWLYFGSLRISGWVIQLGASIFDVAYNTFVLKLGCWFVTGCAGVEVTEGGSTAPADKNKTEIIGNGQIGAVVNEMWQIVRDVFNIFFIFALIYIGIRTILFTEDSNTRRMLGLLIAAALLINFSLYIAKTIVDVANFTAVQIHTTLEAKSTGTFQLNYSEGEGATTTSLIALNEGSIAGGFMTAIGFASFFQTDAGNMTGSGYVMVFSLMLLVFSLILAFTFAYAGLMLLFRFIAIIFYLIFSPLMFLAWVVPQFSSVGKKWWSGFLGYAFYAPVFVFLILLTLFTLQGFVGTTLEEAEFGQGFQESHASGMMNAFVFFAIAIGLLLTSTKVADTIAKQTGAIGMSATSKWSRRVTTGAGAAAGAWAGGRIASSGLGWAGKKVENASNRVPGAWGGSNVRSFGERLQKTKIGGASSYKERTDASSAHDKARARKTSVDGHKNTLEKADLSTAAGLSAAQNAFRDMSNPQLLEIAKTENGRALIKKHAHLMSASQMKAIADSDDINDKFTGEIGAARQSKMADYLRNEDNFKNAGKDELTALGLDKLMEPEIATRLSDDKIKSLDMAEADKAQVKKAKKDGFKTLLKDKKYADISKNRDTANLAQLPDTVLTDSEFINHLANENKINARLLKLVANRTDNVDTKLIGQNLQAYYKNNPIPADVENYFRNPQSVEYGVKFTSEKNHKPANQRTKFNVPGTNANAATNAADWYKNQGRPPTA